MKRLAFLSTIALLATGAHSVTLWAIGSGVGDGSSNLYTISNYATAPTAVNVGEAGTGIFDIAWDPTTNTLFGVAGSTLYTLNTTTGAATAVGSLGVSSQNALEVDAAGNLYSWGFSSSTVHSVNKNTAAATAIGDTGYVSAGDLAVDASGQMFGASGNGNLIKVNTSTGAGTLVGSFGVSNMFGLEVDTDGVMYGGQGGNNNAIAALFTINSSTGAATSIGAIANASDKGLYGLTFQGTPVPEPATMLALGLGGAALIRRRKK